ncbi:MAG: PIN domain-containing protein [Ferruginibacter sp.]
MNVFLDANVLVSVLNKEYPLFGFNARILSLADNRRFKLFTSPICLAIAFYFSEKKSGTRLAKTKIELIAGKIDIALVDKQTVLFALHNKKVHDLEDGMQFYAAKKAGCQVIVTSDTEDYYFSDIEILKPKQFLDKYVLKQC